MDTARRADSSPLASRRNRSFSKRLHDGSSRVPMAALFQPPPPPPETFVLCVFIQLRKQKKKKKKPQTVADFRSLFDIHFLSSRQRVKYKK